MDTLSEIVAFVRVVEAEGFTAAARLLHQTPSAVSKAVARLEDRLGVRLLNRTTRSLSLTAEGEILFRRGQRILHELADAEEAVGAGRTQPRGLLRVNTSMGFGTYQLVPLLASFRALYPEIQVEIALMDRLVDLVEEGADVAIRLGPLHDSSLIARKLCDADRLICAAPAYLARFGVPAHPDDLLRHNCVTNSVAARLNDWPFRMAGESRRIAIKGDLSANNGETIFQLGLAGLGIVRIADFIAGEAIRDGRLVPLLRDFQEPETMPLHAVYPHRRHLSPKVEAFVRFLAAHFAPLPPWRQALVSAAG